MKDDNLKETAKALEEKEDELQDEFKRVVEHVKMHVNKTTSIAKKDANKEHNRYLDIGKTILASTVNILQFLSMTTRSASPLSYSAARRQTS